MLPCESCAQAWRYFAAGLLDQLARASKETAGCAAQTAAQVQALKSTETQREEERVRAQVMEGWGSAVVFASCVLAGNANLVLMLPALQPFEAHPSLMARNSRDFIRSA